ncbi:Mss4-like protein [Apiospora arundinis]
MGPASSPPSPQDASPSPSPSRKVSISPQTSDVAAPTIHTAAKLEELDEHVKAIDSKLTLINNIFNLQGAAKSTEEEEDDASSDRSFNSQDSYGSHDSYDEQLVRDVITQSVQILGRLSNTHKAYQRKQRRRRLDRGNKNSIAAAERELRLEEVQVESALVISTAAYLENKPATLAWVDWPRFAIPWKRDLEESLQSPLLAVDSELDWQTITQAEQLYRRQGRLSMPGYEQRNALANDPVQELPPERLKIQSTALTAVFQKLDMRITSPPNVQDKSIVFTRPFKEFVYLEKKLRDHLNGLETHFQSLQENGSLSADGKHEPSTCAKAAGEPHEHPSVEAGSLDGGGDQEGNREERPEGTGSRSKHDHANTAAEPREIRARSITALLHLRCLMKFFDDEIKPKIEYISSEQCRKILFHDLWHLYKPGDEVIDQTEKQAFRIVQVRSPHHFGPDLDIRTLTRQTDEQSKTTEARSNMTVHCVYIDFNGKEFGPISVNYTIPPFGGLKNIDSLPIYPLRLAKNASLRGSLIARGKMLLDITRLQPMYYTGDALHTGDEIDSQVMVDFTEALSDEKCKAWTPEIEPTTTKIQPPPLSCYEICCELSTISPSENVDQILADEFIDGLIPKTPFRASSLILSPRPLEEIVPGAEGGPKDEEYLVMTYRAFAFVLRTRKWAQLNLTHLRYENKAVRNSTLSAFDRLELPDGHRDMVKSLVTQHFRDRIAAGRRDDRTDLIRGKGKGLIMLLHGAPGVGKTTTAGDLGTTARDVEQELEKNFSLESRWGCILLLDEADVFLSARERKDFKRNGLVAVFLRVLEYYTGILFLTTNRIGDFDEAFASRIHMSLYYPELDEMKTKKVFKLNMDLIQERFERQGRRVSYDMSSMLNFAEQHYREHQLYNRWNGRQIRNACQTALALAEYDSHGGRIIQDDEAEDNTLVELQLRHFQLVQKAYLDFGCYLGDIRGTQGDRRAFDYNLRAKSHKPYKASEPNYPSTTSNAPGLNANRYQMNPQGDGYNSPYGSQTYPSQGTQGYNPATQDELRGSGGVYTTGPNPTVGQSIFRQQGQPQGQAVPSGLYDNRPTNPPVHGYSYSGNQPTQMEPRFFQASTQQGGGQAWGNPGPGVNQGYPPATQPQQAQGMGSSPQWQANSQGQQQYQGQPMYQGGGAQGPTDSGVGSSAQSQAPYGSGQGGPVISGAGPGA